MFANFFICKFVWFSNLFVCKLVCLKIGLFATLFVCKHVFCTLVCLQTRICKQGFQNSFFTKIWKFGPYSLSLFWNRIKYFLPVWKPSVEKIMDFFLVFFLFQILFSNTFLPMAFLVGLGLFEMTSTVPRIHWIHFQCNILYCTVYLCMVQCTVHT